MRTLGLVLALACAGAVPAHAALPLPAVRAGTAPVQAFASSVEREQAVRTWANDPGGSAGELLAAMEPGGDWSRRAAAYEALWRAARAGLLAERPGIAPAGSAHGAPSVAGFEALERALRAELADPRPRTLDRLLELVAVWPRALPVDPEVLRTAAEHPHPSSRLAAVRCLERVVADANAGAHGALLLALVEDPDQRVAIEARRAWVASPRLRAAVDLPESGPGTSRGVPSDAAFGRRTQGVGGARGLSADTLERAHVPSELLSSQSPLGLAIDVRLHGRAESARALGRVWERVEPSGDRDVLLRAARAARVRGLPLAETLLARLGDPEAVADPERRLWMLQGLVAAGEPGALFERLAPADASVVLGLLIGHSVDWDLEAMRPLVDPERSERELRLRTYMTLASGAVDGPGPGPDDASREPTVAARLLELGLGDPDGSIVEVCFRALCATRDPGRWMDSLYTAWSGRGPADRQRFLRYLPRQVAPAPFRSDLVRLTEDERRSPSVRAAALELLAAFRGDADLARRVDEWLTAELERFAELDELAGAAGDEVEADSAERRVCELRCTGLVRALHGLAGPAAVPRLVATLGAATLLDSEDLGKVVAATLGQTNDGRAALEDWLGRGGERRARIEAGIQLAPGGSQRAVEVLVDGYAQCDWELRTRILKALGRLDDPVSFEFLRGVAADPDQEWELRHLGLAGIAHRGRGAEVAGVLREVFETTRDPELRRSVIGFFGVLGGPAAQEFLEGRLAVIEALDLEGPQDGRVERARSEREALLVALGQTSLEAGALPDELLAAWLRLPRAAGERELEARFVGRKLATTGFRYGAELALGELVAATGRGREALDLAGPWWTFDARFLAALGDRLEAGGDVRSARAVWRAALIGLEGEGDAPDRPALELRLRRRLMHAAEGLESWEERAVLAELVLRDWRMLRTPSHAFVGELGEYQPERGQDPERLLASAVHQSRARAALSRGELDRAGVHAAAAAARVGFSRAAKEAQERLETDLAAAR